MQSVQRLWPNGPSQEEMDCILEAAAIMKRFEGVPQFDWLDDLEKNFIPGKTRAVRLKRQSVSAQPIPYRYRQMVQAHIRSYCSKESNRNKLPSIR